ncbi:MAG: CopD family protein [Pseudomonadota bacterium]
MIEVLAWAMRCALLVGALLSAGHVMIAVLHGCGAPRIAPAILALIGASGGFMVQASALTGTPSGAFDPVMLGLLWSTVQGTALAFYVAGALILILGAGVGRVWVQAAGAAILLSGFLVAGHVADLPGWTVSLVLAVHLGLAAYWVGVLWPLYRLAGQNAQSAGALGHKFGQVALAAIPALIALGIIMAVILLDRFDQLWTTDYGVALVTKVSAVVIMLGLGAANKLRHVPAVRAGAQGAGRQLRASLAFEAAAVSGVLAATAAFSTVAGLP